VKVLLGGPEVSRLLSERIPLSKAVYFPHCGDGGWNPTLECPNVALHFRKTNKICYFYRNSSLEVSLTHEYEHSRGFTQFNISMSTNQTTGNVRHATTLALRIAVMRVVKQRKTHRNFLQASAETEARLLEGQPNSIFMYGL
jgi:hypothetical protein